ncbi:ABC transporter ATP-binding protein [Bdellovibrio sp. HCB337]|uniref:ABC transporter ATP-binding protein n=1 Tax=Bdellovibrio sp. HCB337 TaxID=3394358 RepID=UPI0039A4E607
MAKVIEFANISFSYRQSAKLIDNFNLNIHEGEVIALLGPSGCGKTTLINLVAGHLKAEQGTLKNPLTSLTIFQKDGLLPWLTVKENIDFGHRYSLGNSQESTEKIIQLFKLEQYLGLFPFELSGGLRQKTEIARGLAAGASLLLMDEPFSSLDAMTRIETRVETFEILKSRKTTVIIVTHDLFEAAQVADRVVVLGAAPFRVQKDLKLPGNFPRQLTSNEFKESLSLIAQEMETP